jgi:hypothetical protein
MCFEVNHHTGPRHHECRDDFVLHLDRAVAPPILDRGPEPFVIENPVVEIVGSLAEAICGENQKRCCRQHGNGECDNAHDKKNHSESNECVFFHRREGHRIFTARASAPHAEWQEWPTDYVAHAAVSGEQPGLRAASSNRGGTAERRKVS